MMHLLVLLTLATAIVACFFLIGFSQDVDKRLRALEASKLTAQPDNRPHNEA